MEYPKPLPQPTPTSQPFWDALGEGKVTLQRCDDCGAWVFYPRSHCSNCLSPSLTWTGVSGRGKIYAYTIAHRPTAPHFADASPQFIAVVELEEGVRMNSVIVDAAPEDLEVGMTIEPVFHKDGDATLLYFRPTE